jgi:opacity protein-like surface antigen
LRNSAHFQKGNFQMKKFIALAALLAASTAFAGGFGSVEYSGRDGVDGTADARATKVTMGTDINQLLKADFSLRQKTNTDNDLSDTRLEAGLTATQPIGGTGFSVYGRGAVGEKFKTSANYTYYSVEPGIKYAVTPALSVKAGYRYRAALDSANADTTRSYRLGAEYAITKNYFVGLGYDRVRGDSDYNATNVSVGFKF